MVLYNSISLYILKNNVMRFIFSTPSPPFIVCRLFDDSHSDWCEVISHCNFDLHFSNNLKYFVSVLKISFSSLIYILWQTMPFHFVYDFICCAEVFKLNYVPFVYFCFYFQYSGRWIREDLAAIYVEECSIYAFFKS